MRIIETKVYQFDELSDKAKEKAIEQFSDVNIDYEWWQWTYDDAEDIGIKITEFDLGRGSYCRGEFYENAEDVARKIIEQHGEGCETYQTAKNFLADYQKAKKEFEEADDYDPEYMEFEDSGDFDDLRIEFQNSIFEDYRIILEKEYEYLTSEEAIVETIKTNEYEFTEDGKLF
jgi:tetratricopeptide (TPR) repeat protein